MSNHILTRLHNLKTYAYVRFYSACSKIKPQVLFSSFRGNQYSDNPRVISEYLHQYYPDINIVWALNFHDNPCGIVPSYVRRVKYGSKNFYNALSQSFCFVTNNEIRSNMIKRNNQLFIQTWHGDRGFKKVLYDSWKETGHIEKGIFLRDNELTDFCVAASDYGVKRYRSAFRYRGEILNIGMPRDERLLNFSEEESAKTRKKLNIPENVKLIIYAPTYRDNHKGRACEVVDLHEVLNWLRKETDNNWIGLYRAHRLGAGISSDKDIIDVSDYPDATDLLAIADALISDYSSIAGDFMLLNRPMVLAAFDLEDYQSHSRTFNCTPEECGFAVAKNNQELHKLLLTSVRENRMLGYKKAMEYYNVVETGNATKAICDRIVDFYQKVCR